MTKPADEFERLLALIEDQKQRLKSLGAGREETMRALADVRDELKRVSRERDELRKQLAKLDRMQTETIALPEEVLPVLVRLKAERREAGAHEEPGFHRLVHGWVHSW